MTQPQSEMSTPYAPLPVRSRGTLEIFDTAFKLFRRYAGVLLAWSALSSLINIIPILGIMAYIFTMPLMFGAVSCVVAAAVRGQNVTFKQVWGFTKPRYGALLGVLILAVILMGTVSTVISLIATLLIIFFASIAANFGWFATAVAWVVGTIGGLIGTSFLLAVLMGWFNLAPVISCLEDANRGTNALSRAFVLLKGNWRKACGVATILALAGGAAWMIIMGFMMFFFYGGWDKFVGADAEIVSGLAFSGFFTLFFIAWTPLQAVVGAVFYLDLRTRKEALDLEWTNYAAKPEITATPTAPPPGQYMPPAGFGQQPMQPMGGPPYAPGSSQPAPPPGAPMPPYGSPTHSPEQQPVYAAPPQGQGQAQVPVPSPGFGAAPSPQTATAEFVPAQAPNSFTDFASQMEAAPQNGAPQDAAPQPAPTPVAVPVQAQVPVEGVAPSLIKPDDIPTVSTIPAPPVQPPTPPVVTQPEPVSLALQPPAVPVEAVPTVDSTAPTFGARNKPNTPPLPPAPTIPVAEEPPTAHPAPPVPERASETGETSSFAPRRFRRPASEDDDYPSSFGGGSQ